MAFGEDFGRLIKTIGGAGDAIQKSCGKIAEKAKPLGGMVAEVTAKMFEKNIVVLGMQESGKTQFIKTLQGKPYEEYMQTSESNFESFDFELSNGTHIKFASGTDIGGSERYISRNRELASKGDVAVLVFDIYKFNMDSDYAFQTRVRFDFFKDGIGKPKKKIVVGSFADKFATKVERENAKAFVFSNLKEVYPDLCDSSFFMIDMRERTQVIKICDKIFS